LSFSGFHPSKKLPFNLPPSRKEGKQREKHTAKMISACCWSYRRETPATEVGMRCLPWTEPAGIAGGAAEQHSSTSKAEKH